VQYNDIISFYQEELHMKQLHAVVLAAGEGKRMHSRLPKVLHPLCGRPMLGYILESAAELTDHVLVVVGHSASQVKAAFGESWSYILQEEQLGTGHAVLQALKYLPDEGILLVLCGDAPLLEAGHLRRLLLGQHDRQAANVLTAALPDPTGYGRIIRGQDNLIEQITEEIDASEDEKKICEINSGTYCFDLKMLKRYLPHLTTANMQKEYYLTDVIALMRRDGLEVGVYMLDDYRVGLGINNRVQLAEAASLLRKRINMKLMSSGVTIVDPDSVYIDYDVQVGPDTEILPYCIIEKSTVIGSECRIGPNTHLCNAVIKDRAVVQHSVIFDSLVESEAQVGPYAYINPEAMED
jgi:bifunctional UDP-N-acetylglucosamine pyrophosphorylase / glucosamine-1-phosphate N-acetyltransferase